MRFGSKMQVLLVLLSLALSFALIACDGEGDEYRHHPLMAEDGQEYAKNMGPDDTCDNDEFFISDCLDACTCCHYGEEDGMDNCVRDCDVQIIRYQNYPAISTEIVEYKECLLGCWSECAIDDPETTCWEQCRQYIRDSLN